MRVAQPSLGARVEEAFTRREQPGQWLLSRTGDVAQACRDIAARFERGGRLLVFGAGGPTTDARHVAVEFVHPVLVGKRPLPAVSLSDDVASITAVAERSGFDDVFAHQIRALARPDDIALGIEAGGASPVVARALATAQERGLLTVRLAGSDGAGGAGGAAGAAGAAGVGTGAGVADHDFAVPAAGPLVVKEMHVTLYHLLWELVHVWLDVPAQGGDATPPPAGDGGELGGLYPFLYDRPSSGDATEVAADVARSSGEKADEIAALRRRVGEVEGERIAACAGALADAFEAGATLFAFGNGGSSTDADALVAALLAPAPGARPLPALALDADVAVVTALANDVGIDVAFARPLASIAQRGDVAVGLSTSGNSGNVVAALEEAGRRGLHTIGIAGGDGGRMAELALDSLFVVPSSSVHRIQEAQTTLYHVLVETTRAALTP